jgi:SAM-dependent methyltransferase
VTGVTNERSHLSALERDDPEYRRLLDAEGRFWASTPLTTVQQDALVPADLQRYFNECHTGSPDVSWFDDLVMRGPFERAAMLGATAGHYERRWFEQGGGASLDVFDISPDILEKSRANALASAHLVTRAVDLNFAELPVGRYQVVFAFSCLHHLIRLEDVLARIDAALAPGGLFAFIEYVGEPRLQFSRSRLDAAREALALIPPRYRRTPPLPFENLPLETFSPFEAIRADEIVPLARRTFDEIRLGRTGILTPLIFHVDLFAFAQAETYVVERLVERERRLAREGFLGCTAYGVYRKREHP